MTRRTLSLILAALTLQIAGGCGHVEITGEHWHATADYVWKDPHLENLQWQRDSWLAHEKLGVGTYQSVSKLTGADVANLVGTVGAAVLKGVGIP